MTITPAGPSLSAPAVRFRQSSVEPFAEPSSKIPSEPSPSQVSALWIDFDTFNLASYLYDLTDEDWHINYHTLSADHPPFDGPPPSVVGWQMQSNHKPRPLARGRGFFSISIFTPYH